MAGGTGGHVMPGLAVAEALGRRGVEVLWLGTAKGIESRLVPAAGIPLHAIASEGLRGSGGWRLIEAPFMLIRSVWQAWRLLRQLRPAVVLGMGGYASGPGGLVAWLMRVPLIVHEQNRVMGLTNRLLTPLARLTLYGFPPPAKAGSAGVDVSEVIGNPVKQGLCAHRREVREETDRLRLLVLGGSQGARVLNQVVAEFFRRTEARNQYEIWHQCGDKLLDETRVLVGEQSTDNSSQYRLDGFIDDMAAAYRWADLVIARAGALTISELCLAGKAAILVPLPTAVGDHQSANANYLVEHRAGVLLPQAQLSAESLQSAIETLSDRDSRQQMADAAAQLARPEAAERVADVCMAYLDSGDERGGHHA